MNITKYDTKTNVSNTNLKSTLRNIKYAKKLIRNILKTKQIDEKFNNNLIEEILSYHPNKQKNTNNIEYLVIRTTSQYKRCLYIKTKNDKEVDISYGICLDNIFGTYSYDKQKYFTIVKAFKKELIYEFNINEKKFKYLKFDKKLKKFLNDNNVNIMDVHIAEYNNCLYLCNNVLKNRWLIFWLNN